MSAPLVSVLLPARNAEATIDRAVESILGQTVSDLELVALDDASSDGTRARLERWAKRDARVRVLPGAGQGLVAVLNRGVEACRGKFLARMDADDESLPRRLETSLDALDADPSLAAVGTQVEIFREDRPASPSLVRYGEWLNAMTDPELLRRSRLIESPLCHPSVTLRREALRDAGGFREGDFPEDYELWLRLLARGHRLRCVGEVLHRWRDHDQRLTWTDRRYDRARFFPLKAEHIAHFLAGAPCIVWGTGPTGLKLTRELRARGVEVKLFVEVSRKKLGKPIHGVPVIAGKDLPAPGTMHLFGAVGAHGAREEIRGELQELGWVEGEHFTFTA